MKKVSVIIPVYNHEKYLTRFLASLEKQKYENLEFIAVDDCSLDHSFSILQEYEKTHKNMKAIHHHENKGVTETKKTALQHADGDYIAVIESDDYISDHYFEELVRVMEETGANIVNPRYACQIEEPFLSHIKFFSKKRQEKAFDLKKDKSILTTINVTHCKLYKREFYHLVDEYFRINEDLCTTYLNAAKAQNVSFSNKAVYHYMQNKKGLCSTELNGYGTKLVKNFVYPLEKMKKSFIEQGLYEFYKEEVDAIIIKNYMEHILNVCLRMKNSPYKKTMIDLLFSLLCSQCPNWEQNPYYKENFCGIELTDFFRTLFVNFYKNTHTLTYEQGDIKRLIKEYSFQENLYNTKYKRN